jgi:hypothetical protein
MKISLDKFSASVTFSFFLIFSIWETISLGSTFLNIKWAYSIVIYLLILSFGYFGILRLTSKFSSNYIREVDLYNSALDFERVGWKSILIIICFGIMIYFSKDFSSKYLLTFLAFFLLWLQVRKNTDEGYELKFQNQYRNHTFEYIVFLTLTAIAILISLTGHRPDLDDSHFLHIASQTLAHPNLVPLTFDTSLGFLKDKFIFLPYRITSYETFIAFISYITGINILNSYYLVMPAISAFISITVAYIFCRWFLSPNQTLLAIAIFLLIMIFWGDSHFSFGNRSYFRIFQGKTLLILLSTPFAIICGLMLMRRPTKFNAISLSIGHIAAIGMSSSGLVMTLPITILIGFISFFNNFKKSLSTLPLLISTLFLSFVLVIWLKLQNSSGIPYYEQGTFLPISASFGFNDRQSIFMILTLLGFAMSFVSHRVNEFGMLILGVFILIINPYLTDYITRYSSNNMSWRIVWAAPIPLILSVVFSVGIAYVYKLIRKKKNEFITFKSLFIIFSLVFFLFANKSTLHPSNNLTWGAPKWKLPSEFYEAKTILESLNKIQLNGSLLASDDIAAWLPILNTKYELVMPGHTFHYMHELTLPKDEFKSRMLLYNALNKDIEKLNSLDKELDELKVQIVITKNYINLDNVVIKGCCNNRKSFLIVFTTKNYNVYKIKRY